ncbi:hypothetical protein [Tenacibaculum aestuarii]|uniref:hypothetical protein n=1 Tax=Tenacibaculum aestuarii TaxID=362781 RepID=UPI003895F157
MKTVSKEGLGVELVNIPEGCIVVINRDEVDYDNEDKVFQLVSKAELENDLVNVYLLDYDKENHIVLPFYHYTINDEGFFVKSKSSSFPFIYAKEKVNLIFVV